MNFSAFGLQSGISVSSLDLAPFRVLIVGFSSAIQCVFSPFTAVFTATQRFDLANLIGVGARLLAAGGIYGALRMGYGLIGVSAATCGAGLIDYLLRWRVAYRLVPELEVSRRRANLVRLREMGSFGGWHFLISVSSYVYLYAQTLLIGSFMPIAAVGHYALAANLWQQIKSVLSPVGQVIYPVATELHVRAERGELERLLPRWLTADAVGSYLHRTGGIVLYRLWIGEKYLSGNPFPSVALLLRILLIGTVAGYASNIAGQILLGAGQVRLLATSHICGAGLNVMLIAVLILPYGLAGVTASGVIAAVLVELLAIPLVLQRVLGLSVKDLLSACVRPVAVGMLLATLLACIRRTGQPGDWHLILHGVLAGACAATVVLAVGVTAEERQRFVVQPMRRLLRRETPTVRSTTVR